MTNKYRKKSIKEITTSNNSPKDCSKKWINFPNSTAKLLLSSVIFSAKLKTPSKIWYFPSNTDQLIPAAVVSKGCWTQGRKTHDWESVKSEQEKERVMSVGVVGFGANRRKKEPLRGLAVEVGADRLVQ